MFDQATTGDSRPEPAQAERLQVCLDLLRSIEPNQCDAEAVGRHLGELGRLRSLIDSVEASLTRRADVLHRAGYSADGHDTLQSTQRAANADAARRALRAKTLEQVPDFDRALDQGSISGPHADALACVLENVTPETKPGLIAAAPELLSAASTMRPDTFRRHAQRKADQLTRDHGTDRFERQRQATKTRKWINRSTGMYHLAAELDPQLGAQLFTALETEVESRWHTANDLPLNERPSNDRIAAEALVDLTSWGASSRHPALPAISVLVDHQTLVHGLHDHSTCETSQGVDLTPQTIRRLACDANVIPIVMGGPSQPLDIGRRQRTATGAQRSALRAAHDTCAIENCDTRYDHCQIHHIIHWIDGGTSNLDNMVPLCNKHHHQIHEGNWTIQLHPDRTVTFTPPPALTQPPSQRPEARQDTTAAATPKADRPEPVRASKFHTSGDVDAPPPHPPPARQPARTGAP